MTTMTAQGRERARELVRQRMAQRGVKTRAQLSRLTGLDPNTVGDFINGSREWASADTLTAVEDALQMRRGLLNAIAHGERPDHQPRTDNPDAEEAELLSVEAANRMHAGLSGYTDDELIAEIRARTAFYAARLHANGETTLLHGVGRDGGDVIGSRPKP